MTSRDHARWPGYHVGGAVTCQDAGRRASCVMSFILYVQGPVFQGSIFNFSPALIWPGSILPVMFLRKRCLVTCLICPPVFSAPVCPPEKDVALSAIPSASCISSSSSLLTSPCASRTLLYERNAALLVTLQAQRADTQAQPTLILRSPLWSGSGSDHSPGASPPGIACRSQLGPCRPQRLLSEPSHSRFCFLKVLPLLCRFCLRTSV